MLLLKLGAAAWVSGMVVTYCVISIGITMGDEERFLKTRLWVAVTWPITLGYVAWWTLSHLWRRLMSKRGNGS